MLIWAPGASGAYTFASSWGSGGAGDGQFAQPHGLSAHPSGDIYVADTLNHRVQRFTPEGRFVATWGALGNADGQMSSPFGTAIGPTGDVFVVDRNNHRVQRFTPAGVFVSKFGTVGSGPGQLSHPQALAIDPAGNVYVADYDNRRVVKFDATGNFVLAFGSLGSGDGQFNLPDGIATDSTGAVYVIDGTNRVQKFDGNGNFVLKWGSAGRGDGQFNGTGGIAAGPGDSIFVSDFNGRRIERFTSTGTFLEKFGSGGTGPGQFNRPGQIATTPGGDVYVSDVFVHRIARFRESTVPPPTLGKSVNVRTVKGTVLVKLRGTKKFVRLTDGRQIPVGSTVDTRRGTVELASAADSKGTTQSAQFYKGLFVVAQKRGAKPITALRLTGGRFRGCPRAARGGASTAAKKNTRRLWGAGSGRFRTVGRFASASVRGTTWLTEDRCDGTLVRVTRGSVTVRDLIRRRNVVVTAPGRYFARAKR